MLVIDPSPRQEVADHMVGLPSGEVVLRDEAAGSEWGVRVDAFALGVYPVTREAYRAVLGQVPMGPSGPRAPVTDVSWKDAVRFCNLLSQARGLRPCYSTEDGSDDPDARNVSCDWTADGYRLPTEAEWEYACRAGTSGVRYGELDEIAWFRANSGGRVRDAGGRRPNPWGLHDMIGNVWEWCWDLYDPGLYGPYRVFRGGGWNDRPRGARASCRRKSHPNLRIDDLGFRIARSLRPRSAPSAPLPGRKAAPGHTGEV